MVSESPLILYKHKKGVEAYNKIKNNCEVVFLTSKLNNLLAKIIFMIESTIAKN